jgi:hypothetical protein
MLLNNAFGGTLSALPSSVVAKKICSFTYAEITSAPAPVCMCNTSGTAPYAFA